MNDQSDNLPFSISGYLFSGIIVSQLAVRIFTALVLLLLLSAYSAYHPSFFDQFSIPNQPPYVLGIPGALFVSIFFDWLGLSAYLIPGLLLFASFKDSSLKKSVFLGLLVVICTISFLSIIIQEERKVVALFGALGYSAAQLVAGFWWLKLAALLILAGGLMVLVSRLKLYRPTALVISRLLKLVFFISRFYLLKLLKVLKYSNLKSIFSPDLTAQEEKELPVETASIVTQEIVPDETNIKDQKPTATTSKDLGSSQTNLSNSHSKKTSRNMDKAELLSLLEKIKEDPE